VSTCPPAIQPIASSDYLSEGIGDGDPVASNDTPHDSAQNRHVELSVPASGRQDFCFAL
jgi:flagellar motor protein MotB